MADLAHFEIPDAVRIAEDIGAGPELEVTGPSARARISLFGGQLLAWQPAGQDPVLWLSSAAVFDGVKAIRGGIPVCWPWFAAHPVNQDWPSHGVARTQLWHIERVEACGDGVEIALRLPVRIDDAGYWPHRSRPDVVYRIGTSLEVDLVIENIDAVPIEIGQALHTYLTVGDIGQVRITGLEGSEYIDKLAPPADACRPAERDAIMIAGEVDRIYRNVSGAIRLHDAALGRRIVIRHAGGGNVVVWNPWAKKTARLDDMGPADAYRGMVCIETGSVSPDTITLEPGSRHTLSTSVTVEA